jgi:hypothetical protein
VLQSRPPSKTKSLTGRANQPIYDKPISPLTWCSIPPAFSTYKLPELEPGYNYAVVNGELVTLQDSAFETLQLIRIARAIF